MILKDEKEEDCTHGMTAQSRTAGWPKRMDSNSAGATCYSSAEGNIRPKIRTSKYIPNSKNFKV